MLALADRPPRQVSAGGAPTSRIGSNCLSDDGVGEAHNARSQLAPTKTNPVGWGPHSAVLEGQTVGSVVKKRRKRMSKKKHRKMLKRTRVQRRKLGK